MRISRVASEAKSQWKPNAKSLRRRTASPRRLWLQTLERRQVLAGDSALTGAVFDDANQNGSQDPGEVALANVAIFLDVNDNRVADASEPRQFTGADGSYRFDNLDAGDYVVRLEEVAGVRQTKPLSSESFLFAFDSTPTPDQILRVDPVTGQVVDKIPSPVQLNATNIGMAFDGDSLFLADAATDTVYQINPISGALIDVDLISRDIDGAAALNGKLYLSNPFSNTIFEFDPITDMITKSFPVSTGTSGVDIVGGLAAMANPDQLVATTASNLVVFIDPQTGLVQDSFSHGGQQDVGAAAIGQQLYLSYAGPSFFGTVVFERSGEFVRSYAIHNGSTHVTVRALAGKDVVEQAYRIQVAAGQTVSALDFGRFDARGQISGATFIDGNGDGVWGDDEAPDAGVTVYLDLNDNRQADPTEPTQVTDSSGEYQFSKLLPGNYVVREIPTERYEQTSPVTSEDVLFGIRHGVTPDTYFQIDAQNGDVIRQFVPTYDVQTFRVGLDYDGQSLFVIDENLDAVIELDAETGAELDRDPIEPGQYDGLAYLDGLIYISNYATDDILIFDPIADVVIRKLDINGINPGRDIAGGLAAIGNPDALVATTPTNLVLFIDPQTGAVLSQFAHGGEADNGVAVLGDEVLLSYTSAFVGVVAFERDGTFKRSFGTNFPYYGLAGQRVEDTAHRVVLGEADSLTGLNFGNISLNQVPVANAGGPYEALEGQPVTLDASATTDGENDELVFLWDLDGDGEFGDASGVRPSVDAEQLATWGLADDGSFTVTVLVSDGFDEVIAEATLTIVNAAPTAADDVAGTDEATIISVVAPGLLGNDSDAGLLDVLSVEGVDTTGTLGTVTVNADGSFIYDPNSKFDYLAVGEQSTDTFTYRVGDGDGGYDVATAVIAITGVNDQPVSGSDVYSVSEDGLLMISAASGLLGNDTDADATDVLRVIEVNGQAVEPGTAIGLAFGALTMASDGAFSYAPGGVGDVAGQTESFAYTVSDGHGGKATATVTIDILPAVAAGERTFVGGIVRIGGSDDDDIIALREQGGLLYQNEVNTEIMIADIDEIRVWSRGGHDTIDMGNLNVASSLYGGAGDDRIVGGSSRDLIFGGLGNDQLTGSAGHDFIAGGDGADRLVGASGNDILVAGNLASQTTRIEIEELISQWSDQEGSAEDEETVDEVFSDDDFDMLTGASGANWFIIGSGDKITDLRR